MKVYFSHSISESIKHKYLYLDNDFLSELFKDEIVLTETLHILDGSVFLIDPLTALEFLRDIYMPQQYNKKKKFISNEIFSPATNHQEIYKNLQENALLLSRIYAHQNHKNRSGVVDLFLAARLMYYQSPLLITGNKKDFPSCVFDTIGVLNIEQSGDGVMKPFCLIQFNRTNFEACYSALQKLPQ
jgi:hypothetical protein